jgi:O-antigen ligase/polysaccharide polymerase Wzy-like membrane protein
VVQWVLIGVAALWPIIAFGGGAGFSLLVTLAALLCLPVTATSLRPRLYMVGILMFLVFTAASAKWSPREIQLFEANFQTGQFAMRFEVVKIGLILLWSAILMAAARTMSPAEGRGVVRVLTWAILVQLVLVALLTAFEKQALQLFSFAMPEPGEGIQNISRNGTILALAAPFLIVGFSRQLSFARALLVEILVFVVVLAVLAARGVNGPILSVAVGLAAVAVVRIFPRLGFKLLGLALVAAIMGAPFIFGYISADGDAASIAGSTEWRMAIWKRVIEIINQDPVFGQGLGVLRTVTDTIPSGEHAGQLLVPNHAHNMALQLWAETGAIGASLVSLAVILVAFRMPEPRRVSVAGFLGAALMGQFAAIAFVSYDLWNDWLWACGGILAAMCVAMSRAEAIDDPGRMIPSPSNMTERLY